MKVDVNDTILIVVGSDLVPEEKDRPLAYRLKSRIDPQGKNEYQRAIVVSDLWYLENELFQVCASILLGGPGVNAASRNFYDKLPLVWSLENNAFMQLLQEAELKAALWGMDQSGTEIALNYFVDEHLERFLLMAWTKG